MFNDYMNDYLMEDALDLFYNDNEYYTEGVGTRLSKLGECIQKVFFFSKAYPELNQAQINMKEIYKSLNEVGIAVDKRSTARTNREFEYIATKIGYAVGPIFFGLFGILEGNVAYILSTGFAGASAGAVGAMAFPVSIPAMVVGGVLFTVLYVLIMILTDQVFHINDVSNALYSQTINELQGIMRQCMQLRSAAKKNGNKQMVKKCEKIILTCEENIDKMTKERQGFR